MSSAKGRRRQRARGKPTVPQSGSKSTSTPEHSFQVWDCERMLQFQCPMKWEKLGPSPNADVRHCQACDQDVYLCHTPADFVSHGEQGRCVAIPDEMFPTSDLSHRLGQTSPEEVLFQKALADRGLTWSEDVQLRKGSLSAERIEAIREARSRGAESESRYSPEHLAILRMAVKNGSVPCPQCGADIADDEFGIMIYLQTRQCMACQAQIELELPSK
jgi:hypothetical protein